MARKRNRRNSRVARSRAERQKKAEAAKLALAAGAGVREISETRNPPPEDLDPALPWYVVFTGPRCEAKAARNLEEEGCITFLPSMHRVIKTRRREIEHDVATFPRYLFVSGRPVGNIREIDGVQDVVRSGDKWATVPPAAIAAIAAYQRAEPIEVERPALAAGDKVRVISGPFMSFQATVMDVLGVTQASILLDIFGRPTPVDIEIAQLAAE